VAAAGASKAAWLALRVLGGAALLAVLVIYADAGKLARQIANADLALLSLAIAAGLASNLLSALRWTDIALRLRISVRRGTMILLYARGMAANPFLPGAPVSGDALRSWTLSRQGNRLPVSTLSVLLDRLSGVWILCALSLAAMLFVTARDPGALSLPHAGAYVLVRGAVVALPFAPNLSPRRFRLRLQPVYEARSVLFASAGYSVAVQVAAAGALWLCGLSVGMTVPFAVMLAAAAPIFISAALPIGVAGFGAREMGALVALGAFGVPGDQAIATGLLYGAASVIQGILAAPAWIPRLQNS
jgi:uncharacterized membrane protein YbhN (UPF0104 family)